MIHRELESVVGLAQPRLDLTGLREATGCFDTQPDSSSSTTRHRISPLSPYVATTTSHKSSAAAR